MEVQLLMPNRALDHPPHSHHPTRVLPTRVVPTRVLIVDQSDDSRDVIRTVLERRGVEILEALSARAGLEILREQRPDVIVLDLEADAADDAQLQAQYDDELAANKAEMVILGNLRRDECPSSCHLVRKPYHYKALIEKIEQLASHALSGMHGSD